MNKRRGIALLTVLVMALGLMLTWAIPAATAADESVKGIQITGSKYVAKGKTIKLKASEKVTWESSDPKIATVSSSGKVKGIAAGKVKITATSKANKNVKKTWKMTVTPKAVKKITITPKVTELSLANGETSVKLKAKASPSSAAQSFEWSSSDPAVATVNQKGLVTVVTSGVVTITATATDGSNKKASLTLTIIPPPTPTPEPTPTPTPEPTPTPTPEPTPTPTPTVEPTPVPDPDPDPDPEPEPVVETKYYALLIGNADYVGDENDLIGPKFDVLAMQAMLKGTRQNWQITTRNDLTADGIRSAIQSAYAGSTENDVCLFYYSGHGFTNVGPGNEDYEGALVGIDGDGFKGSQLAYALNENAKGQVLVLLDSCGSGGLIYPTVRGEDGDEEEETQLTPEQSATKFVDSIIGSFSYFNGKAKRERALTATARVNELAQDKFYVLAACAYQTTSSELGYEDGHYSFGVFTCGLVDAVGLDHQTRNFVYDYMPGDTDDNGKLSMSEGYRSIQSCVEYYRQRISNVNQVTKMYGDGDFTMFIR